MIHLTWKSAKVCMVSLVLMAISLPMNVLAVVAPPVVTVLQPISQGVQQPVRMAQDSDGNLYVADNGVRGIVKFNPYGVKKLFIPLPRSVDGVAVAQDGKILVTQETAVVIYNADGTKDRNLGSTFQVAIDIVVDDVTGFIYVLDKRGEIKEFTASGLATGVVIGARGSLPGQLLEPRGLAFDRAGRQLVVADSANTRIQFFKLDGTFVKSMGNSVAAMNQAIKPMEFQSADMVALEYTNDAVPQLKRLYVSDSYQQIVQVIDPAGTGAPVLLTGKTNNFIGGAGITNGLLTTPLGLVFDQKNSRLLVANSSVGVVTVYGIDGGVNPINITPPAFTVNPVIAAVSVPTVSVSGTVEAGAIVKLSLNGVNVPVAVGSATTWSAEVVGLVAGANTIVVEAVSAAGIAAIPVTLNVTYNLPAPAVKISAVKSITNVAAMKISGSVDVGATVKVAVGQLAAVDAVVTGAEWSYDVTLVEGSNLITVSAQTQNSSVGAANATVVLDSAAPSLEVSALATGSYTSTQTQNVTGVAKDGGSVTVAVNGQVVTLDNAGTFSAPVSLVTGANLVVVTATDAAGNVTADTRTINYDSSKPIVSITAPMDNMFTNAFTQVVNGTVDKSSTITVAGIVATIDSSNNWTAQVDLVAGTNTIDIVATDLYGNTSSQKRTVVFDAVKPVLAITTPSQDSSVTDASMVLEGACSDALNVKLTAAVNGVVVPVTLAAGAYTINIDFPTDGNYAVAVTAVDEAGNSTTSIRNIIKTTPVVTPVLDKKDEHKLEMERKRLEQLRKQAESRKKIRSLFR